MSPLLNSLLLCVLVQGADTDDKSKSIVEMHSASVAAIRSMQCDFVFKDSVAGQTKGNYKRSGSDYILKLNYGDGRVLTALSSGGQSKVLSSYPLNGGRKPEGSIIVDDGSNRHDCDPYAYNLMMLYGQDKYRALLSEITSRPCKLRYVGTVERSGRKLERVSLSHARADQLLDFDPSVNYLVRVVTARSKLAGGENRPALEQEVTDFAEVSPGVFVPTQSRCTDPATGAETWSTKFANMRVNQPVPPEAMTLKFPAKIHVLDKVRGGVYETDAAGEPTLRAKSPSGEPFTLEQGASPPVSTDDPAAASREEARPWSRWLMPASVVLLGLGAGLWLLQLYRRRNA